MKSDPSTFLVGLCFAGQLLAQEPAPSYVPGVDTGQTFGAAAAVQKSWHEKNRPTDQGKNQ